jgi:alpha-L-rhamnosidase
MASRLMAGLDIDESMPGYKHIVIAPHLGGDFTEVNARHDTPYGRAASHWTKTASGFDLSVDVPPNTTATVHLPNAKLEAVTEGGKPIQGLDGVTASRQDGETAVVEVGSGQYRFAWK